MILVTYKRLRSCELRIELTHGQIQREIFRRRGYWLDPTQIQRLKRKFITFKNHRPGKPDHQAERFELLKEIDKGSRSQKGRLGKPSAFECTGLNFLLAPEARQALGLARDADRPMVPPAPFGERLETLICAGNS